MPGNTYTKTQGTREPKKSCVRAPVVRAGISMRHRTCRPLSLVTKPKRVAGSTTAGASGSTAAAVNETKTQGSVNKNTQPSDPQINSHTFTWTKQPQPHGRMRFLVASHVMIFVVVVVVVVMIIIV